MAELKEYDDLFGDTTSGITQINTEELKSFPDHPFSVRDDEEMEALIDSVKEHGILTPITVRKSDEGGYEIISGHRRTTAAKCAGLETVPAIVKDIDNEQAVIEMVDANLQRENLLPSEKAAAYSMKLEALRHIGLVEGRTDEVLAKNESDSARNIQRYIRLTNLVENLRDLVDEGKIPLNAGVELSYISSMGQDTIVSALNSLDKSKITLAQAKNLRKTDEERQLKRRDVEALFESEQNSCSVTLKSDLKKLYFDKEKTNLEIEEVIVSLLTGWREGRFDIGI